MLRYIAHALSLESAEILRTTGSLKTRNEIPNPRTMDSIKARRRKKGSWEPVGRVPGEPYKFKAMDAEHLYLALSDGTITETRDGGARWEAAFRP